LSEQNNSTEMSHESSRHGRKPRLRPGYRFMEPDELTPHERWDRILELLTIMAMPRTPLEDDPLSSVLTSKSNNKK